MDLDLVQLSVLLVPIYLRIEWALVPFFAKERQLLESGARENALAHWLAIHIDTQSRRMDADAEYDKMHVEGFLCVVFDN
jgi:hypothetical protein